MRSMCLFVVVVVILVAPESVTAQERRLLGSLTRSQNSVTKVMRRSGCDLGWLHQVLADSGIEESKVRQLPVGQRVYLRNGSCRKAPPASTAMLSWKILGAEWPDEARIATLEEEVGKLRASYTSITEENRSLKSQLVSVQSALTVERASAVTRSDPSPFIWVGLIALLLGGVVAYFFSKQREKGMASFPMKMVVREDGEIFEFALVGVEAESPSSGLLVGKYKCPKCPERNLFGREKNLRVHARKHAVDRLVIDTDPSLSPNPTITQRIGVR